MPKRVLIANRGAIARRVVAACAARGIESVAVFSEADAGAPYLEEATHAVALKGVTAEETYLNVPALLAAARESQADSVHPGYGFLAENADFARSATDAGLTFIGPEPRFLEDMGDKVQARALMAEHGFPVFAGSEPVAGVDEALAAAGEIGYPLMLKPVGGGGGIGMRVVHSNDELADACRQASALAERAFADGRIYLERLVERGRHIEIQVLGDGRGGAVHAYERECTVQRRHQKLIEESPAPLPERGPVLELAERACAVTAGLGYNSVGTFETLRDARGEFGFLEMNTRIQVEHGVTELVTGLDLVATQIGLAGGEALPEVSAPEGFALEARLYAEDSANMQPSTGRLTRFRPPEMTGVRIETGFAEGQFVTPFYDPLLAKVLAHGTTREQAIGRVYVALKAFEVQGVATNAQLLMTILQHPRFLAAELDTGFVDALTSV